MYKGLRITFSIGEEMSSEYLQYIKGCGLIQSILYTPDMQGDVHPKPFDKPCGEPAEPSGQGAAQAQHKPFRRDDGKELGV